MSKIKYNIFLFEFPTVSFLRRYYFELNDLNIIFLMERIKIQNDLATKIKKEKQKSKIEIFTKENDLLVKSLKKPG